LKKSNIIIIIIVTIVLIVSVLLYIVIFGSQSEEIRLQVECINKKANTIKVNVTIYNVYDNSVIYSSIVQVAEGTHELYSEIISSKRDGFIVEATVDDSWSGSVTIFPNGNNSVLLTVYPSGNPEIDLVEV
jgi:hypothetical protein